MFEINTAYSVLSDPIKRKQYDCEIKEETQSYREQQGHKNADYCDKSENGFYDKNTFHSEITKQEPKGAFSRFVHSIGKEIIDSLQENSQILNNAYIEGFTLSEYTLIRRFTNSKGYKRAGYAKALEEKGMLEKDTNGQYRPTYKYKYFS